MPVELSHIRNLLMPGLYEIRGFGLATVKDEGAMIGYDITYEKVFEAKAPSIWVPKLSIPQAVAVGAAAAIIKNPEVTRRFWKGWFNG